MKFIKLHQGNQSLLVNICNVTEVHPLNGNKSRLFFNVASEGCQASIPVDESPDEILELIKQVTHGS